VEGICDERGGEVFIVELIQVFFEFHEDLVDFVFNVVFLLDEEVIFREFWQIRGNFLIEGQELLDFVLVPIGVGSHADGF